MSPTRIMLCGTALLFLIGLLRCQDTAIVFETADTTRAVLERLPGVHFDDQGRAICLTLRRGAASELLLTLDLVELAVVPGERGALLPRDATTLAVVGLMVYVHVVVPV